MPVDYSKWDALELSDDSDIEVHPNVDKRSFIRAKQNQIHMERQQRKHQIETLKYERLINDALTKRISGLLSSLKAHVEDAATRNPAEVAFQAVMESSPQNTADDTPPPRPAGVHDAEEPLPSYTKMMAGILDVINKTIDEKKVEPNQRYGALMEEVEKHLRQVEGLQQGLLKKLAELEKEESKKITSESYHTGFDSSHVTKSTPSSGGERQPPDETKVELLNPNYDLDKPEGTPSKAAKDGGDGDDEHIEASPAAKKFAKINTSEYQKSLEFLSQHPEVLTERETDGLLIEAFDAAIEGKDEYARQCVHQALLLQYCRALGKDGVRLFFKRITTPGHQAQEVFAKDVQDTYGKIRTRAREIAKNRESAETGVEQIQLQAVEPGTTIQIRIPPADSEDPEVQKARAIFDMFQPEMRKALESGVLDEVNRVLGDMKVEEAEDLVGLLSEAGCIGVEDQIIDATTEEGRKQLEEMRLGESKATNAATMGEGPSEFADDPE